MKTKFSNKQFSETGGNKIMRIQARKSHFMLALGLGLLMLG